MGNMVRWRVTVSRDTDLAVRVLLASRGHYRGDLSRFVEDAVNREIMRRTMTDVRSRNADRDAGEIARLADVEVRAVRERP